MLLYVRIYRVGQDIGLSHPVQGKRCNVNRDRTRAIVLANAITDATRATAVAVAVVRRAPRPVANPPTADSVASLRPHPLRNKEGTPVLPPPPLPPPTQAPPRKHRALSSLHLRRYSSSASSVIAAVRRPGCLAREWGDGGGIALTTPPAVAAVAVVEMAVAVAGAGRSRRP